MNLRKVSRFSQTEERLSLSGMPKVAGFRFRDLAAFLFQTLAPSGNPRVHMGKPFVLYKRASVFLGKRVSPLGKPQVHIGKPLVLYKRASVFLGKGVSPAGKGVSPLGKGVSPTGRLNVLSVILGSEGFLPQDLSSHLLDLGPRQL